MEDEYDDFEIEVDNGDELKYIEPDPNSLESKVSHARKTINERHFCPYQYGAYHINYCDLSENDLDVPCPYIGAVIVDHDGLEYHECKYSSERTEVRTR